MRIVTSRLLAFLVLCLNIKNYPFIETIFYFEENSMLGTRKSMNMIPQNKLGLPYLFEMHKSFNIPGS